MPTNPAKHRLRWLLLGFFLALSIPTALLIYQAHGRLKWETIHQHRTAAEELVVRIDSNVGALVDAEESRTFTDYRFLVVAGDPTANFIQRSPLSSYPVSSAFPGIVGYFQLEPGGILTTPMLPPAGADPAAYGIAPAELAAREALDRRIREALLASAPPAENTRENADTTTNAAGAAMYEQRFATNVLAKQKSDLATPSVFDIGRDTLVSTDEQTSSTDEESEADPGKRSAAGPAEPAEPAKRSAAAPEAQPHQRLMRQTGQHTRYADADQRAVRKEQSAMLEAAPSPSSAALRVDDEQALVGAPPRTQARLPELAAGLKPPNVRVRMFESEVEPMNFARLDSRYFVLFRNVWRDGQRFVQGVLIDQSPFIDSAIESPFLNTALSDTASLGIGYSGETLRATAVEATEPLYRARLSPPFGDVELAFTLHDLPLGPGADVILWTAILLAAVLCGGFFGLYRLGASQIELNRQQRDFVAAVSHELKTPLTSIRMYGEMLREGWADEAKKRSYYDFIFDESERLSRLIANVLRLSRLGHAGEVLEVKPITVGELLDNARSKVASAIQRAGFELVVDADPEAQHVSVLVEADSFCQIVINLVDNALKFAARADRKVVVLATRLQSNGTVLFSVRDYGPGVPKKQMKRIFELFYRGENELTRETVGTGIGLALVLELATAMKGRVDVHNCDPGVEFLVYLPVHRSVPEHHHG